MISVMQMLANCWCLAYHAVVLSEYYRKQLQRNGVNEFGRVGVGLGSPAPYPDEMGEMEDAEMDDEMEDEMEEAPSKQRVKPEEVSKHVVNFFNPVDMSHASCDPTVTGGQRILRICGVGFLGVLLVAFLPCCCLLVEKSPCANPLRRAPKDVSSSEEDSSEEDSDSDDSN
ncbi:hypothetical protein lerEdw1_010480 [Lerista edwardsae]|nr:hypothetical protein lerEdw1_010480 [Lerista edwardsae]